MDTATTRRDFLKAVGLLTVMGSASLAGCTTQANEGQPTGPKLPNEPNYKGFLDGTDNYSHTLDWREKDAITIEVGSEANMGAYGFSPAAVAISPGTRVTWEWTGRGGTHNVVATQGTFNSGEPVSEAGTHFEYTFDRPGTYTYVCEPHEAMGMKGAIFVGLGDPVEDGEATS
ncbi:halocyanin domain-containing protein [Halalkalicoccus salilacus]|uniref:halocyanin domain-containing protein n=1 Tax=Halalkalicoccus TaxID=332246 RepID=UPI002F967C60